MRTVLQLNLLGDKVVGFSCHNTECSHRSNCAQHVTAGDFRGEDGPTPDVVREENEYVCYRRLRSDLNGEARVDRDTGRVMVDSFVCGVEPLHGDIVMLQALAKLYEQQPSSQLQGQLMGEASALDRKPLHQNPDQEVPLDDCEDSEDADSV